MSLCSFILAVPKLKCLGQTHARVIHFLLPYCMVLSLSSLLGKALALFSAVCINADQDQFLVAVVTFVKRHLFCARDIRGVQP